ESMSQLTQLTNLDLRSIGLRKFPEYLTELTQLKRLNLFHNNLRKLPDSLGQLKELESLLFFSNSLECLPNTIGKLRRVKWMFIGDNRLVSLPNSIDQLVSLQKLDLEHNLLRSLPDSIGGLKKLIRLDLADNRLESLPESLTNLTSLRHLFLHSNPALNLPEEVLGAGHSDAGLGMRPAAPRAILAFYFAQQQRNAKPVNEVKLLLVGHGRVGKTSLSKAVRGNPHDNLDPETAGIERHSLKLTDRSSPITAHIWDFGGQEFLHQTHQFFFSQRSMYVVVLSGRDRQPMPEAQYWLRLIRAYGTGSPVVIVLNKIKEHPFTIDEYFLQENYPEVKAVVRTDCQPRFGIEALRKALGKLAGEMPSVREKITPAWARV